MLSIDTMTPKAAIIQGRERGERGKKALYVVNRLHDTGSGEKVKPPNDITIPGTANNSNFHWTLCYARNKVNLKLSSNTTIPAIPNSLDFQWTLCYTRNKVNLKLSSNSIYARNS